MISNDFRYKSGNKTSRQDRIKMGKCKAGEQIVESVLIALVLLRSSHNPLNTH